MTNKRYKIIKLFIGGLLKGLTYEETRSFPMTVGFTCKHPVGGSPYKIILCEEIWYNFVKGI